MKRGFLVLSALLLTACTPKLDPNEVNEMLIKPSRGLFGGVELGDSWDKLKADHDKRYTVRDEKIEGNAFLQLRHDLGDPGQNGFYLTFHVDGEGKVERFEASIHGQKDNAVTVRKLLDDVIAHFDAKVGNGHCGKTPGGKGNSSYCSWTKDGGPSVNVNYMEFTDPISGTIRVEIAPPRKR